MKTVFLKMGAEKTMDAEYIKNAGDCLKQGGLVAFPTETVYGIKTVSGACLWFSDRDSRDEKFLEMQSY